MQIPNIKEYLLGIRVELVLKILKHFNLMQFRSSDEGFR